MFEGKDVDMRLFCTCRLSAVKSTARGRLSVCVIGREHPCGRENPVVQCLFWYKWAVRLFGVETNVAYTSLIVQIRVLDQWDQAIGGGKYHASGEGKIDPENLSS